MKFFEHFFQTDEIKKQELTKIFHEIDKSSWIQVLSACLGKMMVIQNNASECIVKGRGWNVDLLHALSSLVRMNTNSSILAVSQR